MTEVLLAFVVAELGVLVAQQRRLLGWLPQVIKSNVRIEVWLARLLGHHRLSTEIEEPIASSPARPPARSVAGEITAR